MTHRTHPSLPADSQTTDDTTHSPCPSEPLDRRVDELRKQIDPDRLPDGTWPPRASTPVSILIPVKNEQANIVECIRHLTWAQQIVVMDSQSTDLTSPLAQAMGAEVYQFKYSKEGWPKKKNWALQNVPWRNEWVLIMDADERMSPELANEVRQVVSENRPGGDGRDGYWVNRRFIFMGRWIKHCGLYPSWNVRLFKHRFGRYERIGNLRDTGSGDNEVHEHVILATGDAGYLKHDFVHFAYPDLDSLIEKHNRYATWEAHAMEAQYEGGIHPALFGGPIARRRWLRVVTRKMPFRPLLRFLYTYIFQLGFLDGRAGYTMSRFLSWYEFISLAKYHEMQMLRELPRRDGRVAGRSAGVHISHHGRKPRLPAAGEASRIVGLSVYHGDAAAAGIEDGQFTTGVEEERFTRVKHWAGFPRQALRYVLKELADNDLTQVSSFAVARLPRAHLWRKVLLTVSNPRSMRRAWNRVLAMRKVHNLRQAIADTLSVDESDVPPLYQVEHHLAHIASSYFCCPWEEAICLTVDGFGDFASTMRAVGRGNRIEPIDRVFYPHSLGMFYTAITQYLGFPNYGDEYKMMGLAAYGEPNLADKLRKIVLPTSDGRFVLDQQYFVHLREGVNMTWEDCEPFLGRVFSDALIQLLGEPPRSRDEPLRQFHNDLAASAQRVYEEQFFELINSLAKQTGIRKLALAGGCALNSLANGKIFDHTDIDDVFIQSAAGDAGTSLGAALYVYHAIQNNPKSFVMEHASWGPKYDRGQIRRAIVEGIPGYDGSDGTFGEFVIQTVEDDDALCRQTAASIAQGDVVGWYQDRSEWGPRALGNRSILADPRRNDMRNVLNLKIKRRESFRPFAPSILEEKVPEWFTITYPDPFMLKVYPIKPDKRSKIPAVTHADGTGRLQSVTERSNRRYYKLIKAFEHETGVPMVLNTSFNENEPIVNTPGEALDCFLRTKMDRLVLENIVIFRKKAG